MYIILRSVLLLILLISLTGASTIQGPIPTPNLPVVLTDGSTITVAPPYAGQETTFTLTITGASHTLQNPSTLLAGQFLHFIITQNGTGGFTPLWDTHYTFPYGAVSYNLAASAISVVSCVATTTSNLDCVSGTSSPSGGNPTATIGTSAVNGSSGNFMRADGAPAIPQCSSSTFGACKVDNSTITAASGVISATAAHVPTFQRFVSGSAATYTTPANARELIVKACGAGAGGGGTGATTGPTGGNTNGTTTFNSINAAPGSGGVGTTGTSGGAAGAGGTGGTGSASYRVNGQAGGTGYFASGTVNGSPPGGLSGFGSDGKGGAGAVGGSTSRGGGGSGGGGECFALYITSPSGTYTYTVGTAGTGGIGTGTGAVTGSAGTAGSILVEEYY